MHDKGVSGSARRPNTLWLDQCRTVKEEVPSTPLMTPEKACEGNGVELFPLNLSGLELGGQGLAIQ